MSAYKTGESCFQTGSSLNHPKRYDFVFPSELLLDSLAQIDRLKQGTILAPHRVTCGRLNNIINERIPGDWIEREGFVRLVPGGNYPAHWALDRDAADIPFLHGLQPHGFPPYILRIKVGSICILICNYDPRAGLFNGTRVQITGFVGDHLIKVRILDGRSTQVGQNVLLGRAKIRSDASARKLCFRAG